MPLIWESVIYVKPCLYSPLGSKAKWSSVNPYAQCIVHVMASWIGNCILVIIWVEFEPIWISLKILWVSTWDVFCVHKSGHFFILVNWPLLGLLNKIQMTCELGKLLEAWKSHMHHLLNHHVLNNYQHKVQPTCFSLFEILNVIW